MSRTPFLERIERGSILFDGGLGTELYKSGVFINRNYDAVNLADPELVTKIHRAYIDAGAEVIETNTFGANRLKLHHAGLTDKVEQINTRGVEIARKAAGKRAYVAGAVGPSGVHLSVEPEQLDNVREAFDEQIRALIDAGADMIVLETFSDMPEMKLALEVARKTSSDIPIVAQMAFGGDGKLLDGTLPDIVARELIDAGANVIGANCAQGPAKLYHVAEGMVGHGVPVSIQPNAGYPKRVGERYLYMATPEYFAVYAMRLFKLGVRAVGGCCGTNPEFVRQMSGSARMTGGGRIQVHVPETHEGHQAEAQTPWPPEEKSPLGRKLFRSEELAVSVEINPPLGLDPGVAIARARLLKAAGVDVINIPDNARASVRMSNASFGVRVRQEVGIDVILHVCLRDRNFLATQSEMLGYHVLGIRNLVIITGDPPKVGDYPDATAVFDMDSVGLLRMVRQYNRGLDPSGRPLRGTTSFLLACGAEPGAADYDAEIRRLERKKEAGAEFVMTQPVYEPKVIDRFLRDIKHLDMPVMIGLLPLGSYKNAEFLHNEVPGMQVPKTIRDRMAAVGRGPDARAEGVRIAQEALLAVRDRISGVYIMPPFGRVEAAIEILECVGYSRPVAWREEWRK